MQAVCKEKDTVLHNSSHKATKVCPAHFNETSSQRERQTAQNDTDEW